MIKRLLRMGDKRLQITAEPVEEFNTPFLNQLIEDLFDTMKANAGVGIAAPQIGVPLQVIVFGFNYSPRYSHANPVPETVLINPTYSPIGDETYDDWEGCLSVKGLRGLAARYTHIKYSGQDQFGMHFEREVNGFHARLVQHEIDHLQGSLFVERITNLKNFGFEEEIQQLMLTKGRKLS